MGNKVHLRMGVNLYPILRKYREVAGVGIPRRGGTMIERSPSHRKAAAGEVIVGGRTESFTGSDVELKVLRDFVGEAAVHIMLGARARNVGANREEREPFCVHAELLGQIQAQ